MAAVGDEIVEVKGKQNASPPVRLHKYITEGPLSLNPVIRAHLNAMQEVDAGERRAAFRKPTARANPASPSTTKTITQLKGTLRRLGIGILGEILSGQTLKSCSGTAPQVQNYLAELGYTVSGYGGGGGYSNHYDLGVLTRTGWYSVDPTFMQFHCRYQGEDVTPASTDPRVQAFFQHLYGILVDGLSAFEIIKISHAQAAPYETIPDYFRMGATWAEFWQKRGERAFRSMARLAAGTPHRNDESGSTYAAMLWTWMQLHNKRLPKVTVAVQQPAS